MKINPLYSILFVFLLIIPAKAEVFTSLDGYKFEVDLKLQKNTVMLSEPIFMDFNIKNLSETDLGVLQGGDNRNEFGRPDSFNVKVVNSRGEIIPKPKLMTMGGGMGVRKIAVGENFFFRLYLPHWAAIDKIGDYQIEIEKDLNIKKYDQRTENYVYSPKGTLVKLKGQVKVIDSNYQEMGKLVTVIGKQLVAGDDTARKLVPFIKDRRIIKYLIEAVGKNIWLMRNLSKFNDDRALNGILSKVNDPADEIRRNVSVSLALSVHPKAASYLLRMRNDNFAAIRLDVVHFLGKIKTAASTKLLKEMSSDGDEMVSGESKRYLSERGEKLN